ncbi:hypothetical protein ACOMHN_019358 [Nucella lapillus]
MSKTISEVYKQTKGDRLAGKAEGKHAVKLEQHVPCTKSDEEVLREFDLALEFGPCIGISRLERWQRAQRHSLSPPPLVKDLLIKHAQHATYTQSLWNDYNI